MYTNLKIESLSPKASKRKPLRYLGGQWRNSKWIASFFPKESNDIYAELFCGGASVLFNKPKWKQEIINDLNEETVNFFRALRSCPLYLLDAIQDQLNENLTSDRSLIHGARYPEYVRQAAQTYRNAFISFRGAGDRWDSGCSPAREREYREIDHSYLLKYSKRLQGIVICNDDAFKVISKFPSSSYLFLDPPYPMSVRRGKDSRHVNQSQCQSRMQYKHELSAQQHEDLCRLLADRKGRDMICSYQNEVYDEILLSRGWIIRQKPLRTNARTENTLSLYVSPELNKEI
jgi:DNA adenine methylase